MRNYSPQINNNSGKGKDIDTSYGNGISRGGDYFNSKLSKTTVNL